MGMESSVEPWLVQWKLSHQYFYDKTITKEGWAQEENRYRREIVGPVNLDNLNRSDKPNGPGWSDDLKRPGWPDDINGSSWPDDSTGLKDPDGSNELDDPNGLDELDNPDRSDKLDNPDIPN